jgi:peptidoglycan/LPS O-acetylase OafA/YrhL
VALARGSGPLETFLASDLMVTLGEASYAVYLLHWPVWRLWQPFMTGSVAGDPSPASTIDSPISYLFYLSTVLIVSLFAYRLFEIPSKRVVYSLLLRLQMPSLMQRAPGTQIATRR